MIGTYVREEMCMRAVSRVHTHKLSGQSGGIMVE